MPKEIIHFAHANGFPAKTYNKLFSFLENDFEINYLERHAHNPSFPVTDNWKFLARELKEEIEKRYKQKIIGVGHSLGGILHFLVAVENPELYKAIVLLDAPLISRLSGKGLKFLKRTKLIDKLPLARATRFRRSIWQTKTDAFEHFRRKEKFQSLDEEVLRDYIEHGTIEKNNKVKLIFEPQVEAEIYRTIPDDFAKFRGKLKAPAIYIGGSHSNEARLARLSFMRKHFPIDFYFIEGSHLFPLEKPEETAQAIKTALSKLRK
jgi:pimeloyl-ACP methyl ester carboxylesterase